MATKSIRVGHFRKVHKALTELLDEYDRDNVEATDIDLTSAERGGQKPTVERGGQPALDSSLTQDADPLGVNRLADSRNGRGY